MSLSSPSQCRDKALDWYAFWSSIRREEILGLITEELIAEHQANPVGYRDFHSPDLQRVLNYFRQAPTLGKYFVYAIEPWAEYRIAVIEERGKPPTILDSPVFASEAEAMHGVFMRRIDDLRASLA